MFFIKESSVSSRQDESKLVAPKKLRFTAKNSAKKIQPQQREPESRAGDPVSSSEDSDHVELLGLRVRVRVKG